MSIGLQGSANIFYNVTMLSVVKMATTYYVATITRVKRLSFKLQGS